jgi:hypothetical protein
MDRKLKRLAKASTESDSCDSQGNKKEPVKKKPINAFDTAIGGGLAAFLKYCLQEKKRVELGEFTYQDKNKQEFTYRLPPKLKKEKSTDTLHSFFSKQ